MMHYPFKKRIFIICCIGTLLSIAYPVNAQDSYTIDKVAIEPEVDSIMGAKWNDDFVHVKYPEQVLNKVITVEPGESIQEAIDTATDAGGGVVLLAAGMHRLDKGIILKGKVTLAGEGRAQTIVKQGALMEGAAFHAEPEPTITDVVIKDLSILGDRKGKVQGIFMSGRNEARHNRIMFKNIAITHWSSHGVHMKRTDHIVMDNCDFQYNGSGNSLYHNVYFLYNKNILQSDCDMSYPVLGKGNKYTSCKYVLAQRCTIKNSKVNGIQSDHEEAGYLFFHKYHISGCGWVALWFPCEDFYDKFNYTENPKYAPQNVILNRCTIVDNTWGAMWRAVNGSFIINSTFDNEKIDMGLLKCDVTFEDSTFTTGNEIYTDVKDWPKDVKILW